MIRTVTALFGTAAEAEAAFDGLSRRLSIMKGAIVSSAAGERPDFGAIYLSRAQREACEAELAEGGSLLIVQVEGDRSAEQAVALLDRHAEGAAEPSAPPKPEPKPAPTPVRAAPAMPQLEPTFKRGGTVEGIPIPVDNRRASPVPVRTAPEPPSSPEPEVESAAIPLVEEELRVGKREFVRGGARVHSYVEEVPVSQDIALVEERFELERRPVNRRLSEDEIAASGLLQDRVIEVARMREEAVVTKEAVVREELIVKKTVETRVERIDETVRRTAVEMERLEPETGGTGWRPAG